MAIRRHSITVTTASDGSATAYTAAISGKICQIEYVKNNYTDGVDFTITNDTTGASIWTEANVNASKVCAPRIATHSNAGVALLYAAGGTAVADKYALGRDKVKIVLAQGGNATTGTFHIFTED